MNNIVLVGRLTKEPDIQVASTGTKVAKFTLAIYRTKDDTDFIPVTAFDKQADFTEKYFKKGSRVGVVGSLNIDHYKDRNGNNATYTKVVARSVEFCESKKESEETVEKDEWVKDDGKKAPWGR